MSKSILYNDPKRVDVYDDTKCGLFEFINEGNAVQVGYLGWISSTITDLSFYEALIKNNTDIEMKWPKCDVIYSSKMVRLAQKVEWINVPARLLAHGTWVEMCDKSNDIINFDETMLTRSTRRVRHAADNVQNTNKVNIKKINRKELFKKKHVLSNSSKSSIHVMKQIRNRKSQIPKSSMLKKRKRSSSIERNAEDLLDDDDDDDEDYSKSTKDELQNKIKVLNYENQKLRTQVSQQRAIIEASKSISDINKVSNEILLSLHQSLSIIKTKKLNHDNMHNKTITSSQKLMKPHKNISQTVQLPVIPTNSASINLKSGELSSRQSVVIDEMDVINTDITNIVETSATLPKFQMLEDISGRPINNNLLPSHNFGQNDLYDFCVSAAAAMDKPTAALISTLQCLPSELPSQKENFQIPIENCSGQLMDILAADLPISNHSDDNTFVNLVELWPGSGVKVNPNKLALVNRKSFAKLVGDLMLIVFTDIDLRTGSISGKKCNFKKTNESPKKKLNEIKTLAILDFTLSIFPETNKIEIEKAMRMKLNNYNKKKTGPLTPIATVS